MQIKPVRLDRARVGIESPLKRMTKYYLELSVKNRASRIRGPNRSSIVAKNAEEGIAVRDALLAHKTVRYRSPEWCCKWSKAGDCKNCPLNSPRHVHCPSR